jgi:hypothetical protein
MILNPLWHLNADRTVAVSDVVRFYGMDTCPQGVKVLLLTQGGTAVLGTYTGEAGYWGWFPIPGRP